jgi:cytochrome c peroxidase
MRLAFAYILLLVACHQGAKESVDLGPPPEARIAGSRPGDPINPRLLRRFRPLATTAVATDPAAIARVALGTQLFFDPRLSSGGETSCHTCHSFARGGADPRPTSIGSGGSIGRRNAPTVFNAAWHVAQFWDGREPDVEHQAARPILDPEEMAMRSQASVTDVLRSIPGYAPEFTAAFGAGTIDFDHATLAIAAFERTLRTPSRWDGYLDGDPHALTAPEQEGLKVFADVGCLECHTGELVGGSMLKRAGEIVPWPNQADQGRFEITHAEADRMVFKVPSLRNVTLTGPYFHDGSVASLPAAVTMMGKHQLGIELTGAEVTSIVAWLGSLTGTQPVIHAPALPPNGPTTAAVLADAGSPIGDAGRILHP